MSEPHAPAYQAVRTRVSELLQGPGAAAFDRTAPATPEWRVHDVLSHMVGVTVDVVHGRLDGIATDPWTAAQVDARAGDSLDALLDEWAAYSPRFEEMLAAVPDEISGQALLDAATHEHDIRHAIGVPGARDSDAVAFGWDWLVATRTRAGRSAIRFVTETDDVVAGAGDPVVTARAGRFELVRASTGRRSAGEIARYAWDPAPDPEQLLAAPFFRVRAEPLCE